MSDPFFAATDAPSGLPTLLRRQVARCRRELSNLVAPDEHHVKLHFLRLVVDTYGSVPVGRAEFPFDMNATSRRCPAGWTDERRDELPRRIRVGWEGWPAIWAHLVRRHARLDLAECIALVGMAHQGRWWPEGREERLRDWVDADGAGVVAPDDDLDETANVRAFLLPALRSLRAATGGWVWWDAARGRRVFRAEDEGTGR